MQQVTDLGSVIGPEGTRMFSVASATSTAPANSRVNDKVLNVGTTAHVVGGVSLDIGDIGKITSLSPFTVVKEGNLRGPVGPAATPIADNLTTDSATQGLSAGMGKKLDEEKADKTLILSGNRNKCYKILTYPYAYTGATASEAFVFEINKSVNYDTEARRDILIDSLGTIFFKLNVVNVGKVSGHTYISTYLNGSNIDVYLFSEDYCDNWELHLIHMYSQSPLDIKDLGANTYAPPGTLISNSKTGEGCIGKEYHNNKAVLTEAGGAISGPITPNAAGEVSLGSEALPFRSIVGDVVRQGFYFQKNLGLITFTAGTANEKFDIMIPDVFLNGTIEVDVISGWATGGDLSGKTSKRLNVAATVGTINSQQTFYTSTSVNVHASFAISDLRYDATKKKYITLSKQSTSVGGTALALIRFYIRAFLDDTLVTISPSYTTDSTVYPMAVVTLPTSPAVGTNDLQPITAEFFQKELGAISQNIVPNADNVLNIGNASKRWKDFYLASGTINTSDRTEKKNIEDISKAYKDFFYSLRPVSFEFNEGIRTHLGLISQEVEAAMYENGLNSLDFAGFINSPITAEVESDELEERDVEEEVTEEMEFEEEVIEEMEVEEEEVYTDENGEEQVRINTVTKDVPVMKMVKKLVPMMKTVKKLVPKMKTVITGERYGLRYNEFIPLLIKMTQLQQEQIDRLESRIAELLPEEDPQEVL